MTPLGRHPTILGREGWTVTGRGISFRPGRCRREAFDGLCAAELSYSHSDGHVEDKATFS